MWQWHLIFRFKMSFSTLFSLLHLIINLYMLERPKQAIHVQALEPRWAKESSSFIEKQLQNGQKWWGPGGSPEQWSGKRHLMRMAFQRKQTSSWTEFSVNYDWFGYWRREYLRKLDTWAWRFQNRLSNCLSIFIKTIIFHIQKT